MVPVIHVEIIEQSAGAFVLRFWESNPNEVRSRPVALSEIADLIALAEANYYQPATERLREVGERLFRWLDGGERWLSRAIEDHANQRPVVTLAIATPYRIGHLPWETLHDGTTFLLHALNPPVLPVRWQRAGAGLPEPKNRPLQVLFMAASPENVQPVLDYEREEAAILESAARAGLDLTVEESGCLEELGALIQDYPDAYFDVLHLTGHAGHDDHDSGKPVFLLENDAGGRADVTPIDLARAIVRQPTLIFLSGCRTGQSPAHGDVRSFAEELLRAGCRSVLGWGKPVFDDDAIVAAQALYRELSNGVTLPLALVRMHAALQQHPGGVEHWHLLRLFCAGEIPGAVVTPRKTGGRRRVDAARLAESEFLDYRTGTVRVASRAAFVGRRRLLQRALRELRDPPAPCVGVLLHGQGGRGKSSVAARLCDRLRHDFQRIVIVGRLDEASLMQAWASELPDDEARRAVNDHERDLRFRIQGALERLVDAGESDPLFVLDDFEQNQPDAGRNGDLSLTTNAAKVLQAMIEAMAHSRRGRLLITGRYQLSEPYARHLICLNVPPFDSNERQKQLLRLDHKSKRQTGDLPLLERAQAVADGNPRLFEWLHAVLEIPGLKVEEAVNKMAKVEEQFREHILARHLIASLPEDARMLLGRLLFLTLPVPVAAVQALVPEMSASDVIQALDRAAALGLLDVGSEKEQATYYVPRQLGGGSPPLLPEFDDGDKQAVLGPCCDALCQAWWVNADTSSDSQRLEMIRVAVAVGNRADVIGTVATALTSDWVDRHRYQESADLIESILDVAERHHGLLSSLARVNHRLGNGVRAGELFKEAIVKCPPDRKRDLTILLLHHVEWLKTTGDLDEVERICTTELIPLTRASGDEYHHAVVRGEMADILWARGNLDGTLRIRREEELPVYERLGHVRARAITLGQIADVLQRRGETEEALRIRREEQLPVYERLGEVRERAITLGKIADVLQQRGETEEALRIRREEQLPVYERLGDVRSRAIALGKIADVLQQRGKTEEALRIRREEQLPVFERLGDVRERAITLGRIADVLQQRGEIEEALRIRREEQLPVYERLGDVRARAVTLGKIADVLQQRGEIEEALRIRREEVLPVYERLGDTRGERIIRDKIAAALRAKNAATGDDTE